MSILHPFLTKLLPNYDAVLLDAYGVLVNKDGPLPGAVELLARLKETGMPYYILSNAASRTPDIMARDLQAWGLAIPAERLITSGLLLRPYFAQHELQGKPCIVLGPETAYGYVRDAGGEVVGTDTATVEAVIIADQCGYPLLETLDAVLSLILARLDHGQPVHLVLCNPDLIYPHAPGKYGFTAGALAVMMESVLHERYPGNPYRFVRLGKPYPAIFEEAVRRTGTRNLLMIGDQLRTDIKGARDFGIDSLLLLSGVSKVREEHGIQADHILPGLAA